MAGARETIIRLRIETPNVPLARHAGRILDRLAIVFAETAKESYGVGERPQLRLVSLGIGSLYADLNPFLAMARTVETTHDFFTLVQIFTRRLARASRIMAGLEEGEVTRALRAAVQALTAPIALSVPP